MKCNFHIFRYNELTSHDDLCAVHHTPWVAMRDDHVGPSRNMSDETVDHRRQSSSLRVVDRQPIVAVVAPSMRTWDLATRVDQIHAVARGSWASVVSAPSYWFDVMISISAHISALRKNLAIEETKEKREGGAQTNKQRK